MAKVRITVAQLIHDLKLYPQNAEVVVAGDEEGNYYGEVAFFKPEMGKNNRQVLTIIPVGRMDAEDIFKMEELGSHS